MPIHRDLISAAKKIRSPKNFHLTETARAVGLALTEIYTSGFDETDKFDELLKRLDGTEKNEK
jgi:hypothetical protein